MFGFTTLAIIMPYPIVGLFSTVGIDWTFLLSVFMVSTAIGTTLFKIFGNKKIPDKIKDVEEKMKRIEKEADAIRKDNVVIDRDVKLLQRDVCNLEKTLVEIKDNQKFITQRIENIVDRIMDYFSEE